MDGVNSTRDRAKAAWSLPKISAQTQASDFFNRISQHLALVADAKA
jgi:hypothetical protein